MTKLRKEINQEKWNKLLLHEATSWQIIRQLHRSHKVTMFECFVVGLVVGIVIGTVI